MAHLGLGAPPAVTREPIEVTSRAKEETKVKWQHVVVVLIAGALFEARADKAADCNSARARVRAATALIDQQLGLKAKSETEISKCDAEKSKGKVLSCEGLRNGLSGIEDVLNKQETRKKEAEDWLLKQCK
jgi:hypothetical protein